MKSLKRYCGHVCRSPSCRVIVGIQCGTRRRWCYPRATRRRRPIIDARFRI